MHSKTFDTAIWFYQYRRCFRDGGMPAAIAIDSGKIRATLAWQPQHDFESGLRETAGWYLDHPQWVERVLTGKYRLERLGLRDSAGT
jgi:dTDP-D-glucose 4,6-dehydratase